MSTNREIHRLTPNSVCHKFADDYREIFAKLKWTSSYVKWTESAGRGVVSKQATHVQTGRLQISYKPEVPVEGFLSSYLILGEGFPMASDTNRSRISSEEATRKRQDENKEFGINDRDNLKVRLLYVNDSDMLRMEMDRLRTELDGLRKELDDEHRSVSLEGSPHMKEGPDEVDSSSNGGPERKQVDVPDCGDPGRLEMGTGEVETTLEITAYGTITGRTQNTQIRNLLIGLSSRLLFDKDDQSWIQNLESLKRVEEEIFEQEQITPACSVVSELLELEEYRRWSNNLEQLLKSYFLDESLTRSEKIEDEEISWIQQQQRTLEAFLKRGYEELLAKRREVGDLQEKNEGVQETLATLQDSLRDQQTKSKELEDRLTAHREAEEERHKNFVQKAREKTDALKKKLQDLTTKYSTKSEELRSSRQEIARLQKSGQESAETYSSLQTRYDQLDADLNEQEVKARNMETAAKEKQSKQNQELKKLR
ncbi:hypothetical protein EV360DRAFT_75982, partial [Lentinula raphanica]